MRAPFIKNVHQIYYKIELGLLRAQFLCCKDGRNYFRQSGTMIEAQEFIGNIWRQLLLRMNVSLIDRFC